MCESGSTLRLIIASPPTTLPQLARANHSQTASAFAPDRALITAAAAFALASLGLEALHP